MNTESRNKVNLTYFYIITVFIMTFNAVKYWPIPGAISIASGIGLILPLLICRSFFSTNQFGFFLLYAIIVALNFITGDEYFNNKNSLFGGFVGLVVSLSMSYYALKNKDYNLMRVIFYTLFIVLLWTTLATAFYDITTPGIVRYAFGIIQEGGSDAGVFNAMYFMGLSSYALPHALPILIPVFVMGLKNPSLSNRNRIISGIMLVCCLMLVYFSGATGPLLVSIMVLLMSLLIHKGRTSSNVITIVVIILILSPFIFRDDVLLAALDWVDGLIGGEGYFHNKVLSFQDSILYGESSGSLEAREDLYGNTWDVILGNPLNIIIGAQEGFGRHSGLLDRFASLGLVGFVPFICIFISQFKFVVNHLHTNYLTYYYLGIIAAIMMLATKNISGWNMWFFLLTALPFCVLLFSDADGLFSKK